MVKTIQQPSTAEKGFACAYLATGTWGILGNLICNPIPTALKNIGILGVDFALGTQVNHKLKLSLSNVINCSATCFFAYRFFEDLKENPFNPQAFCNLTSVILHGGSLALSNYFLSRQSKKH